MTFDLDIWYAGSLGYSLEQLTGQGHQSEFKVMGEKQAQ